MREWETFFEQKKSLGTIKDYKIFFARSAQDLKAFMGERFASCTRTHKKFSIDEYWGVDVEFFPTKTLGVDLEKFDPTRSIFENIEKIKLKYALPTHWDKKNLLEEWCHREAVFKCLSLAGSEIRTLEEIERVSNTIYSYLAANNRQQICVEGFWVGDSYLALAMLV